MFDWIVDIFWGNDVPKQQAETQWQINQTRASVEEATKRSDDIESAWTDFMKTSSIVTLTTQSSIANADATGAYLAGLGKQEWLVAAGVAVGLWLLWR